MPITIGTGVLPAIRRNPDHVVVQVTGPADPERVLAALRRAGEGIVAEARGAGPGKGAAGDPAAHRAAQAWTWTVSVDRAAGGPRLTVTGGGLPDDVLARIPDLVVTSLLEAGVTDAGLAVPDGTPSGG